MFQKVLIANRGEIAVRIIKTLKKMGIKSVGIFSDVDATSMHVRMADEAYPLEGSSATDSYLNIQKIMNIAKKAGVDAIHPGYGFLSENPEFADACKADKITFIGPDSKDMKALGAKDLAKDLAKLANVPTVPGYFGDNQKTSFLKEQASAMGTPVLIKAVGGGGGRGMRVCDDLKDFEELLESAQKEALASFGNANVLLEKYVKNPRHIEVQIFADHHKNIVHLYARDCTVQRRHQKVVEEAGFIDIDESVEEKLFSYAKALIAKTNYQGAATVEFLVTDSGEIYFIEINTRLQVEHPVTEMITNLDLVEWQLRIAAKQKLPLTQEQITKSGHSIEARLYAEDPLHDFKASSGLLHDLCFGEMPFVRVDTGVQKGDRISIFYDAMIAKVIVFAQNRDQAISLLNQTLSKTKIVGIQSNLSFLKNILQNRAFLENKIYTKWLDDHMHDLTSSKLSIDDQDLITVASFLMAQHDVNNVKGAWGLPWWRLSGADHFHVQGKRNSTSFSYNVSLNQNSFSLNETLVVIQSKDDGLFLDVKTASQQRTLFITIDKVTTRHVVVNCNGESFDVVFQDPLHVEFADEEGLCHVVAPMPAKLSHIFVKKGQEVSKGSRLLTLEAMKIEHTLKAKNDGIVEQIFFHEGTLVDEGVELLKIVAK